MNNNTELPLQKQGETQSIAQAIISENLAEIDAFLPKLKANIDQLTQNLENSKLQFTVVSGQRAILAAVNGRITELEKAQAAAQEVVTPVSDLN